MSGSGQVSGRGSGQDREESAGSDAGAAQAVPSRPLLEDVDGLLDEIDMVLERNAEEFVRGYVQKGGE